MTRTAVIVFLSVSLAMVVSPRPPLALAVATAEWRQVQASDFDQGTPDGVAVTGRGQLLLGPQRTNVALLKEAFVWDLAVARDGTVYAATGNEGRILRITKEGEPSVFFDSDEPEILSLVLSPSGELFAGSSPQGLIYRIDARGQATEFCRTGEQHVWDLVLDGKGRLYAATGPEGRILEVSRDGKVRVLYDSSQTHILCLVTDGVENLYAGSEPDGIIYKVSFAGDVFVLYDAGETDIHALALDGLGNLYAGTAAGAKPAPGALPFPGGPPPGQPAPGPSVFLETVTEDPLQGEPGQAPPFPRAEGGPPGPPLLPGEKPSVPNCVYRITKEGVVQKIFSTDRYYVFGLTCDDKGNVYAATGNDGRIYRIAADDEVTLVARCPEERRVLVLVPGNVPDILFYLGTSDRASVQKVARASGHEGTFVSSVQDCSTAADWGKLSWREGLPAGTSAVFSTRSGNTEKPEETWSDWSGELRKAEGSQVSSTPARFIQYRVRLATTKPDVTPEVRDVRLGYLVRNLAPRVTALTLTGPGQGEARPKKPEGGLPMPLFPPMPSPKPDGGGGEAGYRVNWEAADPDGDKLTYSLYFRGIDEKDWKLLKEDFEETSYDLDAQALPDGYYLFRVVCSDARVNPPDEVRTGERVSDPVLVDTTPPRLEGLKVLVEKGPELVVIGAAVDEGDRVARIEVAVDGGKWKVVFPKDRIFDSSSEEFRFAAGRVEKGEHVVVVRATDRSGNIGAGKCIAVIE